MQNTKNDTHKSLVSPKVLALDLDLTLHDVIAHYDDSINQTLRHFGHAYLTLEELEACGGDNFTNSRDLLAKFLPEKSLDAAVEYYFNHFLAREIPIESLLPGAKELIYSIKNKFNLFVIAVTNADEILARKILNDLNALNCFDYVIGVKEGMASKPNPQMLLIALESIGIKPGSHVWLMGDRATDTLCAKKANCTSIRFYHDTTKPKDPNADLFINNHYDLLKIIDDKLIC